jgi:UDP-glucose 4-epimerase
MDIIEKMGMILNKTIEVEYAGARPGDIRHSLADIRLLRSLCFETTTTSILDGLSATIRT